MHSLQRGKIYQLHQKNVVLTFTDKEGKEIEVKNNIRFIDSMRFMASPPCKLVSYFSRNKLKETMNVFDNDKTKLLSRKMCMHMITCIKSTN